MRISRGIQWFLGGFLLLVGIGVAWMFSLKSNADDWWLEANCKTVLDMEPADLAQAEPWKLDAEREITLNLTQSLQVGMSPESFERLQQRCSDFSEGSN